MLNAGHETKTSTVTWTGKQSGQGILTTTVLEKRRLRLRLDPRLDPNECAIVFSSEQVQQAVRPLTHIANSLLQVAQHAFAMQLLPFVVEIEALQMSRARHFALAHAAN